MEEPEGVAEPTLKVLPVFSWSVVIEQNWSEYNMSSRTNQWNGERARLNQAAAGDGPWAKAAEDKLARMDVVGKTGWYGPSFSSSSSSYSSPSSSSSSSSGR